MIKFSKSKFLSIIALAVLVLSASCTPMITQEQLAKLKQLRSDEVRINDEIANVNKDTQKVQNELNSRMSELKDCNDKKDYITKKLANWPNIWPDNSNKK
jgi:predicted  nucleic acid-binding Zn-ribbon protein